ncbi:MAG: hypothetical protein F6K58_22465 [Symploca sp. SIO2E9]|nr:hypothetical protein [Symploca sp. SIO2E9]
MNYKKIAILTGGFFGICAIVAVTGKPGIKTIALSSLISFPVIVGANISADKRCRRQETLAEASVQQTVAEKQQLQNTLSQLQLSHKSLIDSLTNLEQESAALSEQLNNTAEENKTLKQSNLEMSMKLQVLAEEKRKIEVDLHNRISDLEAQVQEFTANFESAVDEQVNIETQEFIDEQLENLENKYRQTIIDGEVIHSKAMELALKFRDWALRAKKLQVKREEFIKGLTGRYHDQLEAVTTPYKEAIDGYIKQVEILQEKVARLQQRLAGDLTEPVYFQESCAIPTQISNAIAKVIWEQLHIPLAVKGVAGNPNGEMGAGYGYSRSTPVESLISDLSCNSDVICQSVGIHKILSVKKYPLADLIVVSFRRDPEPPASIETIYKQGLIPARDFCSVVEKSLDHKRGGKPTLRVMAATGEGKGIVLKNLLAHYASLEGWELWLSDPVDGSDEDYWDTPKIATNSSESARGYQLLAQLHRTRHSSKQPGFTDKNVLAVFDEFDKKHSDDDKELAKSLMTDIRHTRIRQILVGQCAEVGRNRWAWDDMKSCSLLVLGNSIGTLCKHLSKDLGWTVRKANKVKRQYEVFSEWAKTVNVKNSEIPQENQTRIGLLVSGDEFNFLELPIPHKGVVTSGFSSFRETLNISVSNKENIELVNARETPTYDSVYYQKLGIATGAETTTYEDIQPLPTETDRAGHVGVSAKPGKGGLGSCKKHPEQIFPLSKDGRGTCKTCGRRLPKSQIEKIQ